MYPVAFLREPGQAGAHRLGHCRTLHRRWHIYPAFPLLDSIGESRDLNQLKTWLIPLLIASKMGLNCAKVSRNGASLSMMPVNTPAKKCFKRLPIPPDKHSGSNKRRY